MIMELKYRGMKVENNLSAPTLTLKAKSELDAALRVLRATDRLNNAGEPFFSYYDLRATEIEPGLWRVKLFCFRDAINVRGKWYQLDGQPAKVPA